MAILKTTSTAGDKWKLAVDRAGTATLSTADKYVDRDIQITVPAGSYEVSVQASNSTTGPVVTPKVTGSFSDSTNGFKGATTSPLTGTDGTDYFIINPEYTATAGSSTITMTPKATIGTSGWIDASDKTTTATHTIQTINTTSKTGSQYYLPISTTSNSIITGENKITGNDNDDTAIDQFIVTVELPEGYYRATTLTKTFEQILPDISSDAPKQYILSGYRAYDETGKVIVGSMLNKGAFGSASGVTVTKNSGTGAVTGSNVVLSTTNNSGISVTGSGTVKAQAQITDAGYYVGGSSKVSDTLASGDATKYISEITLGSGKTLTKITNGGTIATLDGTGTIDTLSGTQTVNSLTGALTILAATDADANATNGSNAKLIFGSGAGVATLVKDGKLVTATVKEGTGAQAGKIVMTQGWVAADTTLNIATGDYSVALSSTTVDPQVRYTYSVSGIKTSATSTGFSFTYGGEVTPGKKGAVATITKAGYIPAGSKTVADEDVGVTVSNAATINIQAAAFNAAKNTTYYTASTESTPNRPANTVPTQYIFSVSTEGYTSTGTKKTLTVFDGTYAWA